MPAMQTIRWGRALSIAAVGVLLGTVLGLIIEVKIVPFAAAYAPINLLWHSVIVPVLCTLWYFRAPGVAPSVRTGVYFGLVMLFASFLLGIAVSILDVIYHVQILPLGLSAWALIVGSVALLLASTGMTAMFLSDK